MVPTTGYGAGLRLVGAEQMDVTDDPTGCILPVRLRDAVRAQLPPAMALRDWRLRYSTEHHGCSLRTAFHRLAGAGPTVLLVLDAAGHTFGAYASEAWQPAQRYYGTGESFLFRASPGSFAAYHWTGKNSHFQLASVDSIAMGGGGHFGLWLDEAFEFGSSGPCETYDSPRLSSEDSFRVIRVEFWECVISEGVLSPASPVHAAEAQGAALSPGLREGSEGSPLCIRAERQGSSAFLLSMMHPSARV